jgi:uncharacterized protein YraI
MTRTKTLLASTLAVGLALLPVTADAASSKLTARATGILAVYDQPGSSYRTLLFKLASNERVYVLTCTRHARWCEVQRLNGKGEGWVDGSYLVGEAAKNAVTPYEFTFNPMDPLDLFNHKKPKP